MRTYGDGCGIAHALDLIGERWALLVVRELLLGPKRFTDLRDGLPNASANVLSQRLRDLEHAAVVTRRRLPPPAGSWVYELTDWGRELKPIVISLGAWALRSPSFPSDAPVGTDSVMLALGRGAEEAPDAIVETDAGTLSAVIWQGRELALAMQAGDLRIKGDRAAVTRLIGLFPRPVPVAA